MAFQEFNKKGTTYHATRMKSILQIACRMIKKDPTLLDDLDDEVLENRLGRLRVQLKAEIPQLGDRTHCPNCDASMAEYADQLDINVALLLLNMGRLVTERSLTMPFTDANKIRVSAEARISHTQKCHTTRASKLGLIAKAGGAHWSITKRGFEALRGEQVPKMRVTFRGKILERPEETTTLAQVFSEYRNKMGDKEARKKSLRHDHRAEFADYDPREYVNIAGYHQGELL